ncbi:MAG: YfhO family protein, partial [Anaerolineae bacterium]
MTRYGHSALLLVLLAITLTPMIYHPNHLLYPRSGEATDLTITHWPAVAFNARTLRQYGQLPLWRTTIAGGGPWAANPQSWLFYPPAWVFFLRGVPISLAFNLLLATHLVLAALATYAFGRQALDLKPAGSVLAGLAFALAPWLSAQLAAGHANIALALAWLPVAMLSAHRAATTGRLEDALPTGVAWAAALLNHAQMAAFTVLLSSAWFLLVARTERATARRRRAVQLLLMGAVAALLSAVLLIPLAEALPYLNRSELTADEAGVFSLPWASLLTMLIPTYGGEPEQTIYVGLPVVVLAAVGLALKRDRATWFLSITAALAALFALGNYGPLFSLLFRAMPGLGWLRVPPRVWVLVAFSLALMAGRGLDAMTQRRIVALVRRRATRVALASTVVGLSLTAGLIALYRPAPIAAWSLASLSVLTALALLLRARLVIKPRFLSFAILMLTAADLGLVRCAWTEMRAPSEALAWGAEVASFLAERPGRFRIYSPSYSLPQHTAVHYGLFRADGVDPFQLAHYARFLARAGGYEATGYSVSLPPWLDNHNAQPDANRLGLLNVGYVAADFAIQAEGLVLAAKVGETYIYQNERLLPRAFVTGQPNVHGDVALEWPIEAIPAHISAYAPNHIVVETDLTEPGLLVLSEVWYPGWRAQADGAAVPIHRVQGVVRGVFLDAGPHTVEFRYSPWTVWAGLAVSGGAVLGLVACAISR